MGRKHLEVAANDDVRKMPLFPERTGFIEDMMNCQDIVTRIAMALCWEACPKAALTNWNNNADVYMISARIVWEALKPVVGVWQRADAKDVRKGCPTVFIGYDRDGREEDTDWHGSMARDWTQLGFYFATGPSVDDADMMLTLPDPPPPSSAYSASPT